MAKYPAQIDNNTSLPPATNLSTPVDVSLVNKLRDAIIAVESELGIKPSGVNGTVKDRFNSTENLINNLQIVNLAGDLGGTITNPQVVGLFGRPLSNANPGLNDTLRWSGSLWEPSKPVWANVKQFGAVGNGTTDDTLAVQTALSSNFKIIFFPDGIYLTTGLTINSNKCLTGNGTIKLKANTDQNLLTISGTSIVFSIENISIDGNQQNQITDSDNKSVYFTSVGTSSVPAGLTIDNVTFINGAWADISIKTDDTRSTNEWAIIRGCRFLGGRESATNAYAPRFVDIRSPINYLVENNSFDRLSAPDGYGRAGVLAYDGFATILVSARGVISGNIFNRVGRACVSSTLGAIDLYDQGRSTTISGNTLINTYGRGIQTKADGYGVLIIGNTIDGLLAGSDGTIASQIVVNAATTAPHNNANGPFSIVGNTLLNSGNDAISVTGRNLAHDGYAKGFLISSNNIKNPVRRGIGVIQVTDCIVQGNTVVGGLAGIHVEEVKSALTCNGNTLTNQSGNGIELTTLNTSAWVIINNNSIHQSGARGIDVGSATSGMVSNNTIKASVSDAIRVKNTSSTFHVVENVTDGIVVDGGNNTALVVGSTVESITGNSGTCIIASTAANMRWEKSTLLPKLFQETTTSATGQALTIQSQNAATTGGTLVFAVGTGATPNGNRTINFNEGTLSAIRYQINPSGVSTMSFQPAVTDARIAHNSTSIADGAPFGITAQSSSGVDFNGGNLTLTSGSATGGGTSGNGGLISLNAGNSNTTSTGNGGGITLNAGDAANAIGGDITLSIGTGTTNGKLRISNIVTDTTAGSGGTHPVPANAVIFASIVINGTTYKIALYPVS